MTMIALGLITLLYYVAYDKLVYVPEIAIIYLALSVAFDGTVLSFVGQRNKRATKEVDREVKQLAKEIRIWMAENPEKVEW